MICSVSAGARRAGALSNRNLSPDLDNLIAGKTEEVADMDGVALHHGEEPLLPGRQAEAVLAADHRLMADIIGDVVKIVGSPGTELEFAL